MTGDEVGSGLVRQLARVLPAEMAGDEVGIALVRALARALPAVLDDDGLQELAAKLHPYLDGRLADDHDARRLMTVAEVAKCLRVNAKWVYAHQHRLGAIKLGDGPKARLRFDAGAVHAELERFGGESDPRQNAAERDQLARSKRTRRRLVSRPLPAIEARRTGA
jgi:hypothetical protein